MRNLIISLILFACVPAYAQDYQISAVRIEGNQRIDSDAIKLQLKKTSGKISSDEISEEVKALYKTGFFEQITASMLTDPNGKQSLRYTLVEKPTVRKVFIRGNKEIEESDLAEVLVFDARRFLDKAKLEGLIRKAVTLYQGRGFYDATFEYSIVPVAENQVDITFTVQEGQRYKIREVVFRGLKELDEADLRSAIQTKRYKWWNSWLLGTGRLNKEQLENDRALVRQYFLDHGYLDATISDSIIEKQEDNRLQIVFDIEEGPVYRVGAISASGDLIGNNQGKTLEGIETESGDIFSASQLRQDTFAISAKFSDIGYAFVNVQPNTAVDRTSATVNLNFIANKGNLVTVNRINIKGNEKTYDHVIRRELKINEQETYSGSKIRRSQELLQRLGYFEEVTITSEPVGEHMLDLDVNVREGSTGTFSAGAGYSTSDGALFNVKLSENNLFGTGRRAAINADIGTERDSIVFSLDDRRLWDTYVAGGLDIMRTDREFSDFDRRLQGAAVTLGYPLEEVFGEDFQDISASVKYEYLDIKIDNVDVEDAAQLVIDSEGTSTASGVTPKLQRNTINNPLNPTHGSRQELSVELTGLGGNQDFYLLEGKNTLYYPLVESSYGDLVFSWRTSVGYGESFDDEPFPLYRRYFPGGINSVRGYKNRSLGPKDARGNEFGGSKELVNNFELIFPLVNAAGLKGVIFYDAGEAFDDNQSMALDDLRTAYGLGVRWFSPLGPIRIEFGFPIDRREGEDSMVTMFSFGAPL